MRWKLAYQLPVPQDPPTEFRLFRAGQNETEKGTFTFSARSAKEVLEKYTQMGVRCMFDWNHASIDPKPVDAHLSGRAAGWFDLEVRNGELWATRIEWTPAALKAFQDKEYAYFSPCFDTDKRGVVVAFVNCAITNLPATHEIEQLVAASTVELDGRTRTRGLAFADISDRIVAGIQARGLPNDPAPSVLAVYDHSVVYSVGGRMFREKYRVGPAGEIELAGDAQPVRVEYTALSVVPYKHYPLDDDSSWDAADARKRIATWASSDGSGDPDTIDRAQYRLAFAIDKDPEGDTLGSLSLPHHDVRDGKLVTSRAGVLAAGNALQGARGGVDAAEADQAGGRAHLGKHYREFDLTPPWEVETSNGPNSPHGADTEEPMAEVDTKTTDELDELRRANKKLTEELSKKTDELDELRRATKKLSDEADEAKRMARKSSEDLEEEQRATKKLMTELTGRLQKLEQEKHEDRIRVALKAGNILPFQAEYYRTRPEAFADYMANGGAQNRLGPPTGELQPAADKVAQTVALSNQPNGGQQELSREEQNVCAQMGVTEEQYRQSLTRPVPQPWRKVQ